MDKNLTAEYVRSILDYDPDTGILRWKHRSDVRKEWNTRYAGKITGVKNFYRYLIVTINNSQFCAHKIAWLIMTGKWPSVEIDHRDTNRSNNKWDNLRQVTSSQNKFNAKKRKDNTSGIKGISWNTRDSIWIVQLYANGKSVFRKRFINFYEAKIAIKEARKKYHGEFARMA